MNKKEDSNLGSALDATEIYNKTVQSRSLQFLIKSIAHFNPKYNQKEFSVFVDEIIVLLKNEADEQCKAEIYKVLRDTLINIRPMLKEYLNVLKCNFEFVKTCSLEIFISFYENINNQLNTLIKNSLHKTSNFKLSKEDALLLSEICINISLHFYNEKCQLEAYLTLKNASDFILIANMLPKRELSLLYFKILFNLFVASDNFNMALNALYRIISIDKQLKIRNSENTKLEIIFFNFLENLVKFSKLKNEQPHSSYFLNFELLNSEEVYKKVKNVVELETAKEDEFAISSDFNFENWIFLENNFCKEIEFDENLISFISFLEINGFKYSLKNKKLVFTKDNENKSISKNVYSLIENIKRETSKENLVKEKPEEEKIVKEAIQSIKAKKESDKIVEKKKDVELEKEKKKRKYKMSYKLFRLYSKEFKNEIIEREDSSFYRKDEIRKKIHEENETKIENLKKIISEKNSLIEEAVKELEVVVENAELERISNVVIQTSNIPEKAVVKEDSWRKSADATESGGIYVFVPKKTSSFGFSAPATPTSFTRNKPDSSFYVAPKPSQFPSTFKNRDEYPSKPYHSNKSTSTFERKTFIAENEGNYYKPPKSGSAFNFSKDNFKYSPKTDEDKKEFQRNPIKKSHSEEFRRGDKKEDKN